MVQMSVSNAATGCTIRMDESDERAPLGSEKSDSLLSPKSVLESKEHVSSTHACEDSRKVVVACTGMLLSSYGSNQISKVLFE